MKLSFTTLGCPGWSLETIVGRAREYGYDGIDFRGYMGDNDIWKYPEFSEDISATRRIIADSSLEVPCLSTSIRLLFPDGDETAWLNELDEYCRIASEFETPFIRVFGGHLEKAGLTHREEGADRCASFLDRLALKSSEYDIYVLVETHDDWIAGHEIRMVLERTAQPNTGIIWDIHHPFRMKGESPRDTWDVIGEWVRYVHVKDSAETHDGYGLCLPGRGSIPIRETVEILAESGYSGYLAFEWEKRWHPEIEEPEKAFPAYTEYMNRILREE